MEADANTHPDEGTIHAWLDDALDAATAARIAAHVRECAECAERVAEARGLIAGSSRIIAALDDVPAGTRPVWAQEPVQGGEPVRRVAPPAVEATRTADGSLWRLLRVTPARAAIAATLIVVAGITLTRPGTMVDTPRSAPSESAPSMSAPAPGVASAPEAASGAGVSAGAGTRPAQESAQRDGLLDSAIARNLAIAQPPRSIGAAPGPAIPQAPANAASASAAPDTLARLRVAEGRRAVQAQREAGMDERADRVRTRATAVAAAPAATEAVTAAKAADSVVANRSGRVGAADMAASSSVAGANSCFRIESSERGAMWGGQPLPLVVVLESPNPAAGTVAVRTATGAPTTIRARWVRAAGDSVRLALSRIGYSGAIELGPELAGGRSGIARSGPTSAQLEQVVVTGYGEQPGSGAASESQRRGITGATASTAVTEATAATGATRGRAEAARRTDSSAPSRNPSSQAAPAAAPVQPPAPEPAPVRALPVTMRAVACPSR